MLLRREMMVHLSSTYIAISGWSWYGSKFRIWLCLERHDEIPEDSRKFSKAFLISIEIIHFFFSRLFYLWTAKPYLSLRKKLPANWLKNYSLQVKLLTQAYKKQRLYIEESQKSSVCQSFIRNNVPQSLISVLFQVYWSLWNSWVCPLAPWRGRWDVARAVNLAQHQASYFDPSLLFPPVLYSPSTFSQVR